MMNPPMAIRAKSSYPPRVIGTFIRNSPDVVRLKIIGAVRSIKRSWLITTFTNSVGPTEHINLHRFAALIDVPLTCGRRRTGG
jgi:hypothetical protein